MTSQERQDKKDDFIKYFEEVPVIKYAAMYIEITEVTAHDWLNKDPEFLSRVNQAKAKWAKKRALKTRAEFQLERLDKEIWSEEKKIKVEVDPVEKILRGFGLDVREATRDTEESPQDNS
jgi:hypothetical protein